MVTEEDVRRAAMVLPRTEEHLIKDWVKFRVGRLVYATVSPDETMLGVGFPKEERASFIAAEPEKFFWPHRRDMRYQWIEVSMGAIDQTEMEELVLEAWQMVVPKRIAAAYLTESRRGPRPCG